MHKNFAELFKENILQMKDLSANEIWMKGNRNENDCHVYKKKSPKVINLSIIWNHPQYLVISLKQ